MFGLPSSVKNSISKGYNSAKAQIQNSAVATQARGILNEMSGAKGGGLKGAVNAANNVMAMASMMKGGSNGSSDSTYVDIEGPIGNFAAQAEQFATLADETQKPYYKLYIISERKDAGEEPLMLTAYMPESVAFDYSSSYRAPFDRSVFGDDKLFSTGARTFGYTGVLQSMTYKVWESSNGVQMSIPLYFFADDLFEAGMETPDVRIPVLQLMKLVAPQKIQGTLFLKPPGPTAMIDLDAGGEGVRRAANQISSDMGSAYSESEGVVDMFKRMASAIASTPAAIHEGMSEFVKLDSNLTFQFGSLFSLDNVIVENVSPQFDIVPNIDATPSRVMVNVTISTVMTPTLQDFIRYFGFVEE